MSGPALASISHIFVLLHSFAFHIRFVFVIPPVPIEANGFDTQHHSTTATFWTRSVEERVQQMFVAHRVQYCSQSPFRIPLSTSPHPPPLLPPPHIPNNAEYSRHSSNSAVRTWCMPGHICPYHPVIAMQGMKCPLCRIWTVVLCIYSMQFTVCLGEIFCNWHMHTIHNVYSVQCTMRT